MTDKTHSKVSCAKGGTTFPPFSSIPQCLKTHHRETCSLPFPSSSILPIYFSPFHSRTTLTKSNVDGVGHAKLKLSFTFGWWRSRFTKWCRVHSGTWETWLMGGARCKGEVHDGDKRRLVRHCVVWYTCDGCYRVFDLTCCRHGMHSGWHLAAWSGASFGSGNSRDGC